MRKSPLRRPVHIGLVIALTRSTQPGRVLERLGQVLGEVGSAEIASVVVDRGSTRVSLLARLGRRARLVRPFVDAELELAAEGLRRLGRRFRPNVLLVATDALLDREDRDLECIDRFAVDFALLTRRPLGFFAAREARPDAPAGELRAPRLSRDLVVVPRLGLHYGVMSRAALRRLWDRPDPELCFDLRTVRRLGAAKLDPSRMSEELLGSLAGPTDLRAERIEPAALIYSVDNAEFPVGIRHGQPLPVTVRGWVSGVPPVRSIEVRAGLAVATAPVAVHRPDVVASVGGVREEVCGFDLQASLGPFDPGTYALVWSVPGTDVRSPLGVFQVGPTLEIAELELIAPPTLLPDGTAPLGIRGRVRSTSAANLSVRVDDVEVESVQADPVRHRRDGEPDVVEVRAHRTVRGPEADHLVEVRAANETCQEAVSRASVRVARGAAPGLVWRTREVGVHDPSRGGTPVRLAGTLFGAGAGDRVLLRQGLETLAEAAPVPWVAGPGDSGIATFEIRGEFPQALPGPADLEVSLLHPDGTCEPLDRWTAEVIGVEPGLEVTSVAITGAGAREARVVVEGRVEGATGVDSLLLYLDGELRARLGGEWLEPASALEGIEARFHFFRFDSTILLEEGRHPFEIRTRRGLEERSAWREEREFRRPGSDQELRISSGDLDRLVRARETPVWSRLAISGTVVGGQAGDEVELVVGRVRVARAAVEEGGDFTVSGRPEPGRVAQARIQVWRQGTDIVRSPWFRIAPRALEVPPAGLADLEELLSRLLPGARCLPSLATESTLRALFEREPGAIGEFRRALALLARRAREAGHTPGEVVDDPPEAPTRPLRVLFAAWEPPCSLHGGGVAIRNTLRSLGERHRITLVHTCAPGEEGLSDEVRPWVREIIAVRREWRPPNFEAGLGVSPAFAWSYSPAYREAIEGELATGAYDLFNGDFLRTALHADVAERASIGVSHEVESFAAAATVPGSFDTPEAAADWLAPFLRSLHLEAVVAPSRFQEYVTVTAPEAEFLSRVLPGRRIFVSPIPIDVDALGAAARLRQPAPVPVFLFFGNFIHPPNRQAARLLAEEIAPRVHERLPASRFVIAGSNPPVDLLSREGRYGVHVAGFVPDLTEMTATSTAVLAPIFQGAGMRVKLLEAMASGCPVVSTSLGLSGIGGEPGRTCLVAGSIEEFVAAAVRLAGDPALGESVGRAGRAFVEGTYGIPAQGRRRERIWLAAVEAARKGATS